MNWGSVLEAMEHFLTSAAIAGGGWWFWYTTQSKPRLQLEMELESWSATDEIMIGVIRLIFENKGFIEHTFYNLEVSVRESNFKAMNKDNLYYFDKELLPKLVVNPAEFGINFVRPGVRQAIAIPVYFSNQEKTILITCRFGYTKKQSPLHTYRRYFHIPDRSPLQVTDPVITEGRP